jgi:hypothetical protein
MSILPPQYLEDLERKAVKELGGYMDAFRGIPNDRIVCPWLHHWLSTDRRVHGFLVMQDWGRYNQTVVEAGANIKDAFKAHLPNANADRTLVNLLGPESRWREVFTKDGDWWCMNAVWGRRKEAKYKSSVGYLGDPVHKRAFRFWGEILLRIHEIQQFEVLVLAGDWARFDELSPDNKGRVCTKEYFKLWETWVSSGTNTSTEGARIAVSLSNLDLRVYHSWHPGAWRRNERYTGEDGPPA